MYVICRIDRVAILVRFSIVQPINLIIQHHSESNTKDAINDALMMHCGCTTAPSHQQHLGRRHASSWLPSLSLSPSTRANHLGNGNMKTSLRDRKRVHRLLLRINVDVVSLLISNSLLPSSSSPLHNLLCTPYPVLVSHCSKRHRSLVGSSRHHEASHDRLIKLMKNGLKLVTEMQGLKGLSGAPGKSQIRELAIWNVRSLVDLGSPLSNVAE